MTELEPETKLVDVTSLETTMANAQITSEGQLLDVLKDKNEIVVRRDRSLGITVYFVNEHPIVVATHQLLETYRYHLSKAGVVYDDQAASWVAGALGCRNIDLIYGLALADYIQDFIDRHSPASSTQVVEETSYRIPAAVASTSLADISLETPRLIRLEQDRILGRARICVNDIELYEGDRLAVFTSDMSAWLMELKEEAGIMETPREIAAELCGHFLAWGATDVRIVVSEYAAA